MTHYRIQASPDKSALAQAAAAAMATVIRAATAKQPRCVVALAGGAHRRRPTATWGRRTCPGGG